MKLDELYSIHSMPKKKSNNLLKLFILIVFVLLISFSLARYTGISEMNFLVNIAKFKVSINDNLISNDVTNINNSINLIVDENLTQDGLIKCGQKGHFNIKVDPNDTEVSIKYQIDFSSANLPGEFKLTGYSVDDSNTVIPFTNGTIINDSIVLNGKEHFDTTDVKNYTIYWE